MNKTDDAYVLPFYCFLILNQICYGIQIDKKPFLFQLSDLFIWHLLCFSGGRAGETKQ